MHGDLHQNDHILSLHLRLLHELRRRTVDHVDVDMGDRPKAAPLDENGLLMQDLGGLEHVAIVSEHDGVGQCALHEVKGHQAIVDCREQGPGKRSMSTSILSAARLSRSDSISSLGFAR